MLTNLLADLRRGYFFRRHADTILRIVVILTPFFLVAAAATVNSNKNRVEDWLPSSFRETTELKWFREHFPTDQFLVLSWEGCQLGGDPAGKDTPPDDPRIEQLAALLRGNESAGTDDGHGYSHYFKAVTTARDVLAKMTSPPTELPYEEAVNRLKGSLIGPDGRQTCLVISLTEDGQVDLRGTIGRGDKGVFRVRRKPGILYRAMAAVDLDVSAVRLVGPTIDNVTIDEEGERTLVRLASLAGALGLGLSYWSLRNVRLTLIVFTCGVLSAMLGLALVSILGQEADAVLMSMPALVYVLAISGAVHLVNYYREAMHEEGPHRAPLRAIQLGWKPALLCSVTTAVGLASLYASDLAPIRKFGVFSAIGVMGTLAILFVFLPAALQRFPEIPRRRPIDESDRSHDSDGGHLAHGVMDRLWQFVGSWIIRRHAFVAVVCVIVIAITGYGVTYVRTSIDLLKLFDSRARILDDYAWMESHLGRLVPMEVVVRFPPEAMADLRSVDTANGHPDANQRADDGAPQKYTFLERMEAIQHIKREIEERFGSNGQDVLGRAMSAATFAPVLPDAKGSAVQYARRSATNRQLESSIDAFKSSGYLQSESDGGAELWRISLGVAAFKNLDYGQFTDDLHASVEPMLDVITLRGDILRAVHEKQDSSGRESVARVLLWNAAPASQATVTQRNEEAKRNGTTSPNVLSAVGAFLRPLATVHAADGGSTTDAQRNVSVAGPEDVSRQRILQELLSARRMRVESAQRRSEDSNQALTNQQIKGLKKFDCVVVLGGLTDQQFDDWREAGISVIDGRYERSGAWREVAAVNSAAARDVASPQGFMASSVSPTPSISAVYTGVVPIVYKAQRALLSSLIESTVWSFATITPLMMFVTGSVAAGSVVMIPNALPVLVVFGGMGWLGIPVDIGSMMSASIALGVAVDDTIHFLTWFRGDLSRLKDRKQAILATYRHCATPTMQAALISGLGLSVFAFSTFTPTQRFGWLMLTILIAGVVAELIMFPALLAGPLGRVFRPARSSTTLGGATQELHERAVRTPHSDARHVTRVT